MTGGTTTATSATINVTSGQKFTVRGLFKMSAGVGYSGPVTVPGFFNLSQAAVGHKLWCIKTSLGEFFFQVGDATDTGTILVGPVALTASQLNNYLMVIFSVDSTVAPGKWHVVVYVCDASLTKLIDSSGTHANVSGNWASVIAATPVGNDILRANQFILADDFDNVDLLNPFTMVQTLRPSGDDSVAWTANGTGATHAIRLADSPAVVGTNVAHDTGTTATERLAMDNVNSPNAAADAVKGIMGGLNVLDQSAVGTGVIQSRILDSANAVVTAGVSQNPGNLEPGITNRKSCAPNVTTRSKATVDGYKMDLNVGSGSVNSAISCRELWMTAVVDMQGKAADVGTGADAHKAVGVLPAGETGVGADVTKQRELTQQETVTGADVSTLLERLQRETAIAVDAVTLKAMTQVDEAGVGVDVITQREFTQQDTGVGVDLLTLHELLQQETGLGADVTKQKDMFQPTELGVGVDALVAVGVTSSDQSSGPAAPGGSGSGISRSRVLGGV